MLMCRRLSALQDNALIKELSYRKIIISSSIYTQYGNDTSSTDSAHAGFQYFRRTFLDIDNGLCTVCNASVGFKHYGINTNLCPPAFRYITYLLYHLFSVVVP